MYGGKQYVITTAELPSLWIEYFRGNITRYKYAGCKVGSLAIDMTVGQMIRPRFTIAGQKVSAITTETVPGGWTLKASDSGKPMVARYMICKVGGVSQKLTAVNLTINNDVQRQRDMTSAGTTGIVQVSRSITGSFALLYEDKAFEDAFRAGTTAELLIVCSNGLQSSLALGEVFAFCLPKIKYTAAPKGNENGMFRYDLSFQAVCGGTPAAIEDEIFMAFL